MTIKNNREVSGDKMFSVKIISAKPSYSWAIFKPLVGMQSSTTITIKDDDGK